MSLVDSTYRLRFTGACGPEEFRARCREQDYWYHSFYFDNGFEQRGDYDIGLDVQDYGFPTNMAGMSVLDIGTASGWFATYFEQQGADVTTVDIRGYCDWDTFGRPGYPDISTEKPQPDRILPDGRPVYYGPAARGFWIMKDILGLKAEYVNARVYDFRPELFGGKKFDLVLMGSLLMHVRDPIGALMAIHSVCRDRVIATSLQARTGAAEATPTMRLLHHVHRTAWWRPSWACVGQWFMGAGFSRVDVERTVRLSVDKPFIPKGRTSGASPDTHWLVDAYV